MADIVNGPNAWATAPRMGLMRPHAPGLPAECDRALKKCWDVYAAKLSRNQLKRRYYHGRNRLKDFGISTPPGLLSVSTTVGWPQKAVDELAVRSRFDGFTAGDEAVQSVLDGVAHRSRLSTRYRQAVQNELINSCCFATVGMDGSGRARIDIHSAESASAVFDDASGRIAYGMHIADWDDDTGAPRRVVLDMDWCRATLETDGGPWRFEIEEHAMGRPCMEAFAYRPTLERPFGQSRITRAVMDLTDSAVRVALGGDIAFQFSVSPQKYLLGADPEAFANVTRWEAYIGNMFTVGRDADGELPEFGQLSQGSMQQAADYWRMLAARFAGETNVPLNSLGVISDNPSSAEAIYAASEPLIIAAEDLNDGNRDTLKSLALMCVAAEMDVPLDALTDAQRDVTANFKNPAMPSIVSQADAMVKVAGVVPSFAGTDTFFEQLGFSEDMRRKALADMRRQQAVSAIDALNAAAVEPAGDGR